VAQNPEGIPRSARALPARRTKAGTHRSGRGVAPSCSYLELDLQRHRAIRVVLPLQDELRGAVDVRECELDVMHQKPHPRLPLADERLLLDVVTVSVQVAVEKRRIEHRRCFGTREDIRPPWPAGAAARPPAF